MTDYPCVADTDSVDLAIPGAYLLPSLNIDPDPTNALTLRDNGLYAAPSAMPGARIYAITPQAIGSSAQVTYGNLRWQSSTAMWTGSTIIPQVSGLWLFGANLNVDTGATNGTCRLEIFGIGAPSVLVASDTVASIGTFVAVPTTNETMAMNATGIVNISAGTAVQVNLAHSFGVSVNTVITEACGCEFWAHLLRPATS